MEFFKLCWPNFLLNLHMRVSHSQFHKQDLQKETDSTYQPILRFVPIPLISLQLTHAIRSFHCFPTHTQHQFASLVYSTLDKLFGSYIGWLIFYYFNPYPIFKGSPYTKEGFKICVITILVWTRFFLLSKHSVSFQ